MRLLNKEVELTFGDRKVCNRPRNPRHCFTK